MRETRNDYRILFSDIFKIVHSKNFGRKLEKNQLDQTELCRDFCKERVLQKMVTWKISDEIPLFLQYTSPMFKEM